MSVRTLSNGTRITYFNGPVIHCSGGMRIEADSAVVFETTHYTQLLGSVVFEDPQVHLTSHRANYFSQTRELRAWGAPVLTDLSRGSIIRGDTMVLLRAGESRVEDHLTVTGRRPHATLYPSQGPADSLPAGDTAASVDSTGVSDTLGLPDSLAVPDTVVVPDSVGVLDSLMVADTTGTPDSVLVRVPVDDPVADPDPMARRERPEPGSPGSGGESSVTPYQVDAARIVLQGSNFFRATGAVLIRRDSLVAVADSVEYDQEAGTLFLAQDARVETETYDLTADSIWMDVPEDELRGVRARENAVLEGDQIRLLAPQISVFMIEGRMERLVATGDSTFESLTEEEILGRPLHPVAQELGIGRFPFRPHALAEEFLLQADSIEILAPGEALEELWAMGGARGESMARDSLNQADTPALIRRDWIEGDTIIATFSEVADSLAPPEDSLGGEPADPLPPSAGRVPPDADSTGSRYRLDRLVAKASARSLYRIEPSESTLMEEEARLAVHYVVGDQITILLSEGEVERMEVEGSTRGVHLEPVGRPKREGGSGGIVPDTIRGGGG
jgi:lipopolysaccharide export system protein LptA